MQLADLQSRARTALTTTLVEQWSLFAPASGTSRPSSRTIAFQLGWALRGVVDPSWDVDAEYDRSGMMLEPSVRLGAGGQRLPHLIVHRRGRLGPEDNLLLVQLSTAATPSRTARDLATTQAVQQRFGYRYGVLLDLRLTEADGDARVAPHWLWTTLEGGPVHVRPQRVYTAAALAEIVEQASSR